jgi:hypothetical protein
MVCASEKYASEIEIFTFGRGFRTRISRSSVQKWRFHQAMIRQSGQTDFFNRIGRLLPFGKGSNRLWIQHTGFGVSAISVKPALAAPWVLHLRVEAAHV